MTKPKQTPQNLWLELRCLRIERDQLEQRIRDAVAMCRQPDFADKGLMSWQYIAEALGVTRQAAMQRYADRDVRVADAKPRRQPAAKRKGASA